MSKDFILNNQTSMPGEDIHGLPSNGRGRASESQGFYNQSRAQLPPQCLYLSQTVFSNPIPQKMIGANRHRKYLLIQNNGTVPIFVGFGTPSDLSGANSLQLPPNTGITFEQIGSVPNNEVYVVSSTDNLVCVVEGS